MVAKSTGYYAGRLIAAGQPFSATDDFKAKWAFGADEDIAMEASVDPIAGFLSQTADKIKEELGALTENELLQARDAEQSSLTPRKTVVAALEDALANAADKVFGDDKKS